MYVSEANSFARVWIKSKKSGAEHTVRKLFTAVPAKVGLENCGCD